jgi:hypothetical protein
MKRWRWTLLFFELFLFALILVLPQVDLPDFTFHGGTAPVVAKARISPIPVRAMAAATNTPTPERTFCGTVHPTVIAISPSSDSRLSLLCTLIC